MCADGDASACGGLAHRLGSLAPSTMRWVSAYIFSLFDFYLSHPGLYKFSNMHYLFIGCVQMMMRARAVVCRIVLGAWHNRHNFSLFDFDLSHIALHKFSNMHYRSHALAVAVLLHRSHAFAVLLLHHRSHALAVLFLHHQALVCDLWLLGIVLFLFIICLFYLVCVIVLFCIQLVPIINVYLILFQNTSI